jgi:hypothetical protein
LAGVDAGRVVLAKAVRRIDAASQADGVAVP